MTSTTGIGSLLTETRSTLQNVISADWLIEYPRNPYLKVLAAFVLIVGSWIKRK
jgi:hypothetical protein